jgi:NUMOD4 motif/HNH endonuclease
MAEIWLEIEEAPRYLISSLGRVQNRMTGRILKASPNNAGYPNVTLQLGNGQRIFRGVHVLVAEAFYYGDHSGLEPNHDDGVKTNNFVANLEWMTHSKNMLHAYRTGLWNPPAGTPIRIIETGDVFDSQHDCARAMGWRQSDIANCLSGRQKSHHGYHFEYIDKEEV